MFPLRFIHYILDRLFIIIGAFIGSQFPAFMQQYMHRLAGHVSELDHLIQNLRQVAAYSNKSLEAYIQKFLTSQDPDFFHQGEFMQKMVTRWEHLNQALHHFQESLLWQRPLVFLQDLQPEITQATFDHFQPSFALNVETLCYTGIGVFAAFLIYQLIAKILQLIGTGVKHCLVRSA